MVFAIGAWAITAFNICLWVLTFTKRKLTDVAKAYFWWSFYIALWAFGYGVTLYGGLSYEKALLWNRWCQAMAILIGPYFFRFACVLANQPDKYNKLFQIYLYFAFANAVALFTTPYYVKGLWSFGSFTYQPLAGPLYSLFVAVFFWCTIHGYYVAAKSYKKSFGGRKTQLTIFLISTIPGYTGGATLFLQAYRIPLPSYGVFLILSYVVIVGYAIQRYKFLDIPVLVRRTVVFGLLLTCGLLIILAISYFMQLSLGEAIPTTMAQFISLGIVLLVVDPLRVLLVRLTDRYLFQEQSDYATVLKEASKDIALVTSMRELSRRMLIVLIRKARTKNAAIFVRTSGNDFELKGCLGYGRLTGPNVSLDTQSPLIAYLGKEQLAITKIIVKEEYDHTTDETRRASLGMILKTMNELRAEVIVPSFLSSTRLAVGERQPFLTLRGILALGGKKSDEEYHERDLDILSAIAQEHAIAFENARLYDEVLERSKELTEINLEMQSVQQELLESLRQTETANQELANTNEKLRVTQASLIVAEKNATMVGMAKAIGHEVNNPLTTVDGRARWIYKDQLKVCRDITEKYAGSITEDDRERLMKTFSGIEDNARRIGRSAKRIEFVVKTLTDILKDTKGKMGPLSLIVMCREAIEATRFQTYDENLGGCKIDLDIAANIMVVGNLEQLLQVMVNLIKNAYEAMRDRPQRQIQIEGMLDPDDGRMARIRIADNGPGIPPEVLPKIWIQGFSTKEKGSDGIGATGQGQGLFICKHMVESVHGGQIYAESAAGKGTAFVIRLPLADMEHIQ